MGTEKVFRNQLPRHDRPQYRCLLDDMTIFVVLYVSGILTAVLGQDLDRLSAVWEQRAADVLPAPAFRYTCPYIVSRNTSYVLWFTLETKVGHHIHIVHIISWIF